GRFKPASELAIQIVCNKYNLTTTYKLTLASLNPRTKFRETIEAWERCINQEGLEYFILDIDGDRYEKISCLDLDFSGGSVKLLGYVDDEDLPALYSGATGFILPSLFEGFGLPVIEAMACGTPVITSNTTALDEISGDAALKVSPYDTNAIKEGILELLS